MASKPAKFTQRDSKRAQNAWALAFNKPKPFPDAEVPAILKPKKATAQLPKRSEADVQRDILRLLRHHPKVAIFERHNNGALPDRTGRMVRFNRVFIRANHDGIKPLISDITGTLKSGKGFAFECKEPNWKAPDFHALIHKDGLLSEKESRELGQYAYLCAVREAGGIGIFATSVDDVLNALETVA